MIRITFVIDKLEPGGTQRQLVMLAAALINRGYEIETLVYHRNGFFADDLAEVGVSVNYVPFRNKVHLVRAMRKAIQTSRPDVVISCLPGPNALMGLTGLFRRRFALITSERCFDVVSKSWKCFVRYGPHLLADAVICNSYAQYHHILEVFPRLEDQTQIITNGVDLERFTPTQPPPYRPKQLRILVLARLHPQKNPFTLVEAVAIIRKEQPQLDITVDWYGSHRWQKDDYNAQLEAVIERRSMKEVFRLHEAVKEVEQLYRETDVVCLPSLYEGTSNVICEAMACAVPLLVSRAGDNFRLVEEGQNGLLFDASSARDIANTILQFANRSYETRQEMGLVGRKRIEALCSPGILVDRYIEVIQKVLDKRAL